MIALEPVTYAIFQKKTYEGRVTAQNRTLMVAHTKKLRCTTGFSNRPCIMEYLLQRRLVTRYAANVLGSGGKKINLG